MLYWAPLCAFIGRNQVAALHAEDFFHVIVQLGGKKNRMLHKRPEHAVRLIQIYCIKSRLSRLR